MMPSLVRRPKGESAEEAQTKPRY